MSKYPSGGFLGRVRQKRTEQSPDYFGTLELNGEVLEHVVKKYKEGNDAVQINVSAYNFNSPKGQSIKVRIRPGEEDNYNRTSNHSDRGADRRDDNIDRRSGSGDRVPW